MAGCSRGGCGQRLGMEATAMQHAARSGQGTLRELAYQFQGHDLGLPGAQAAQGGRQNPTARKSGTDWHCIGIQHAVHKAASSPVAGALPRLVCRSTEPPEPKADPDLAKVGPSKAPLCAAAAACPGLAGAAAAAAAAEGAELCCGVGPAKLGLTGCCGGGLDAGGGIPGGSGGGAGWEDTCWLGPAVG